MTDEHGSAVEISPQRIMCPAHGEHLRAQWPKGYAIVSMALFQAAIANPKLVRAIDPAWDGTNHADFHVERLNKITTSRPLCYWVDRATIRQALMDAEIAAIGACDICGLVGPGGPYQVFTPFGIQEQTLCFECALDAGERLHAAHPDGHVWPQDEAA